MEGSVSLAENESHGRTWPKQRNLSEISGPSESKSAHLLQPVRNHGGKFTELIDVRRAAKQCESFEMSKLMKSSSSEILSFSR